MTEWRLLRALRHTHIARLVHVMRDTAVEGATLSAVAETLLLVHEYCAGGSLESYVTRYGALQEQNAGRIVGQLTSALVHCHERQVHPSRNLAVVLALARTLPPYLHPYPRLRVADLPPWRARRERAA